MLIIEDRDYLNSTDLELINKGYAEEDLFSIRLSSHYTDEQKNNNRLLAESITDAEWGKHCDNIKIELANKIKPIIDLLNENFDIHQYEESKNTSEHYRSDWDLYFWCNSDRNGSDYSYITLNFNNKRTVEQRFKDLEKIMNLLKDYPVEGISLAIQYTTYKNIEKIKNDAEIQFKKIENTFINYSHFTGKIKKINNRGYGFFKKGARTHYYPITDIDLLALSW